MVQWLAPSVALLVFMAGIFKFIYNHVEHAKAEILEVLYLHAKSEEASLADIRADVRMLLSRQK